MSVKKTGERRIVATWGRAVLGLVAVSGLMSLGVECKPRADGQAAAAAAAGGRPPAMVTVAEAIAQDVPAYLEEIGKTVAVETVSVVPQVGGKLTAVHVVDGAYVTKGQLLFEIDPRPFEASLASAEALVAQTTAELEWANIEERRVAGLFKDSSATEFEYDQKRVGVAVAKSKLEGAKASVASAKLDLEYSKIYSPVDGRAGARLVDPGNVVRANDKALLVIQRLDPIYAEFTITENALTKVRKHLSAAQSGSTTVEQGLRVEVSIPPGPGAVVAALAAATQPASAPSAGPGPSAMPASAPALAGGLMVAPPVVREGQLTFLDNAVQTGSGTVKLRATLPNADRHFWPGQFVNVRLILAIQKNAVLIPLPAQQIGQQGPFVYVVGEDATAHIRPIMAGQKHGNLLAVDQGLQVGEKVIVTGHMLVVPEEKVMVMNGAPGMMPPGMGPGGPPGMGPGGPPAGGKPGAAAGGGKPGMAPEKKS